MLGVRGAMRRIRHEGTEGRGHEGEDGREKDIAVNISRRKSDSAFIPFVPTSLRPFVPSPLFYSSTPCIPTPTS